MSPLDGEVGSLFNGEARLHWMERWGLHPMKIYRSIVGVLAVAFNGRKRHFPGPFGMSPVFAMWQNRSDQFCHFSALKRREKHFPDHSPCVLTKARYITAECITRQNCAFTKIRLALWGGFWYSNRVLRIGLENPFQGGCNVYAGRDTREAG